MTQTILIMRTYFAFSLLLLVTLAYLLLPIPLISGGWPQEKGKSFIKITYGTSSSNTVYRFDGETKFPTDNGGATVRDYPLADRGIFFYLEHGITDDLTFIGDATLKRSIVTSPLERRSTEGVGDIGLGARYRLLSSGPHVLSGRAGVTLPTGYSRDHTPPLGTGDINFSLAAEYGLSFYPAPAYATATLGYRMRPGIYALSGLSDESEEFEPNYSDVVTAEVEAGYTFFNRFLLKGNLRYLTTTRTDDNDFDIVHPPETEQYLKVGGGVAASVWKDIGISADMYTTPLGKKTANSIDFFIGISWQGKIFGSKE